MHSAVGPYICKQNINTPFIKKSWNGITDSSSEEYRIQNQGKTASMDPV